MQAAVPFHPTWLFLPSVIGLLKCSVCILSLLRPSREGRCRHAHPWPVRDPTPEVTKASSYLALRFVRKRAKEYVSVIPGASFLVDEAFDFVDKLVEDHAPEASAIVQKLYEEMQTVVQNASAKADLATALHILDVLRIALGDLQALGFKAGGKALGPLLEASPAALESLGKTVESLQAFAATHGPKAKSVFEDTQSMVCKDRSHNDLRHCVN